MRCPKVICVAVSLTALVAGCDDDGRTLRPAAPGQDGSISVPSAPPVDEPGVSDTDVAEVVTDPPRVGVVGPWIAEGQVPVRYTCDGANTSPSLTWGEPSIEVAEIAVTVTDDQAPGYVHWALTGLESSATALAENEIPEWVIEATNSAGTVGYTGPCPPAGETHTYRYTIHFLDQPIDALQGVAGAQLLSQINDATIESIELVGTYSRPAGATDP